jgi:transcriptional regulator with XRE-family HTH domain
MELQLTFGEYIRRLRRGRKWNLNTLAEASGISYTHLSRIENDSKLPSVDLVAKLAEALDGDLIAMLVMADCLPRSILDLMRSREEEAAGS